MALNLDLAKLSRNASQVSIGNAIINGDMNIWQRATSFSSIADSAFFADRFAYYKVSAAVHDISRSTDVPSVAQAGRLFNYSALIDCTTVDSSIAAGDYVMIRQNIEGFNWLPLAQKTFTLSFWVKATKTGTYCVSFNNSTSDRSYVAEYTISVSDTWEFKTITVSASPSAGTWDYTTGIGLKITWVLAMGSTYHTTANAWQTGGYLATANQVNACDNTANNFRLTGIKMEPGSVATMSMPLKFDEELAACQRYFCKNSDPSVYATNGAAYTTAGMFLSTTLSSYSTTAGYSSWIPFPVTMRTTPTIAFINTNLPSSPTSGQWSVYNTSGGSWINSTTIGAQSVTASGFGPSFTYSAIAAGATVVYGAWTANTEL
jgi:hypothetical protein